jgi:hypothetical protein
MISYKDPERSSLMCSWIENLTTEREILLGLHIINVVSSKNTMVNTNSITFTNIIRKTERLKSLLGNILMYILINTSCKYIVHHRNTLNQEV